MGASEPSLNLNRISHSLSYIMSKRGIGVIFCILAVVLFLSRYVFALWYRGLGRTTWGSEDFAQNLGYVGLTPWVMAFGFLIAGIVYLVRAEQDH